MLPCPANALPHRLNRNPVVRRHVILAVRLRYHRISYRLDHPVTLVRSRNAADSARPEAREPVVDGLKPLRHDPLPPTPRGTPQVPQGPGGGNPVLDALKPLRHDPLPPAAACSRSGTRSPAAVPGAVSPSGPAAAAGTPREHGARSE